MLRGILSRRLPTLSVRLFSTIPQPIINRSLINKFTPISSNLINQSQQQCIQIPSIINELSNEINDEELADNTMYMDSVLRKRRLKMKKHKLRKRRKEQRSLKKRLGKI